MDEPMSELRLREIRNEFAAFERKPADQWTERDSQNVVAYAFFSMPLLLAEVERLRAENAAMREIVRRVATEIVIAHEGDAGDNLICPFCFGQEGPMSLQHPLDDWFIHEPDCVVLYARKLVEQWDTRGRGR